MAPVWRVVPEHDDGCSCLIAPLARTHILRAWERLPQNAEDAKSMPSGARVRFTYTAHENSERRSPFTTKGHAHAHETKTCSFNLLPSPCVKVLSFAASASALGTLVSAVRPSPGARPPEP